MKIRATLVLLILFLPYILSASNRMELEDVKWRECDHDVSDIKLQTLELKMTPVVLKRNKPVAIQIKFALRGDTVLTEGTVIAQARRVDANGRGAAILQTYRYELCDAINGGCPLGPGVYTGRTTEHISRFTPKGNYTISLKMKVQQKTVSCIEFDSYVED
jgi:hypothetical protein